MILDNRLIALLLLLLATHSVAFAQLDTQPLSLEKALQLAQVNNLQLRQSNVQAQVAGVAHRQAKTNLLPSVNANITHGINQGRSIDPFTNTFIEESVTYGAYNVGAVLLIFNGLSMLHTIRQTGYASRAADLELQQLRDNLTLNLYLTYLQVLNNEDLVALAQQQVAVTKQQLDRMRLLNENGAISPPLLAELEGQLKGEEMSLVNSKLAVKSAKLALAQLINIPYSGSMQLERVAVEELQVTAPGEEATEQIYDLATDRLALVRAAEYRKKSQEAGLKALRGNYYPSLFLFGNLNSNYSSAARRGGEEIIYQDQLENNIFSNAGIGLRIPILNGWETHNRVKLAKLNVQEASIAEETNRVQLRQDIEQAHMNMQNSRERYVILKDQVAAFAEAFRAAEIRFNAGLGTPVDYLIAKNNLDRARTNLLMVQYDYLLRLKIMEFYTGQ